MLVVLPGQFSPYALPQVLWRPEGRNYRLGFRDRLNGLLDHIFDRFHHSQGINRRGRLAAH
jgi:hypothetical protein